MKRMIEKLFALLAFVLIFNVSAMAANNNNSASAPSSKVVKDWTFIVFMNGDNNLDANAVKDLKEMRTAGGSNDFMNWVVMLDRAEGPAVSYYVTKDHCVQIAKHGEVDMGDYRVYANFVKDTIKKYPAKKYCSIIWNHGTGWKSVRNKAKFVRGISYDDQSGNHITTSQLTYALEDITKFLGRRLDLLCFDACLMQMAEVIAAVKDGADYVVGSEETEPGEGYPYIEILTSMKNGMKVDDVANMIAKNYAASYDDGSAGYSASTQSVIKTSAYNNFQSSLNSFCKAMMASDFSAQTTKMLDEVQRFSYPTNIDLLNFADLAKRKIKNGAVQTSATKLIDNIKKMVVSNFVSGYGTGNAYGLAIYFPNMPHKFEHEYAKLAFSKATKWEAMVMDYYNKSVIKAIMAEIEKGKTARLKDYVARANENCRDLSLDLIAKVNYMVFTEGRVNDEKVIKRVKALLGELKNK